MGKSYDKVTPAMCPTLSAQRILGGKWNLPILYFLEREGTLRFGELQRRMPYLTQTTLSRQLKELVACGMIVRNDYREVPPWVDYTLTPKGRSFLPILHQMLDWAARWDE